MGLLPVANVVVGKERVCSLHTVMSVYRLMLRDDWNVIYDR
jgi:hypothetical protein